MSAKTGKKRHITFNNYMNGYTEGQHHWYLHQFKTLYAGGSLILQRKLNYAFQCCLQGHLPSSKMQLTGMAQVLQDIMVLTPGRKCILETANAEITFVMSFLNTCMLFLEAKISTPLDLVV